MQKCGRSWRDGQTPHFITDLARYDIELERALAIIGETARPGHPVKTLVYGHSAGGLIVSLWLDRLRSRHPEAHANVAGLVLNSPFLDLHGPAMLRLPVTSAMIGGLSRVRAKGVDPGRPAKVVTAPHCTATSTESSITTCSGNRWAASPSPSDGCTPYAAVTSGCIVGSTSGCPT